MNCLLLLFVYLLQNKHPRWKAGEDETAFLNNVNEATQSIMTSFYPTEVPPEQSMLFTLPPRAVSTGVHCCVCVRVYVHTCT